MGIIANIVVGAIIGWLASIIAKTNNQMGCLWNIIIGIVGAALGSWIASAFGIDVGKGFSWLGLLISLGGAVLLIVLLRMLGVLKRDR